VPHAVEVGEQPVAVAVAEKVALHPLGLFVRRLSFVEPFVPGGRWSIADLTRAGQFLGKGMDGSGVFRQMAAWVSSYCLELAGGIIRANGKEAWVR
jgi:hypothetical protein